MEEFFQFSSRSPTFWMEEEAFPANSSAVVRCADQEEALQPMNQSAFVANQEEALPAKQQRAFVRYTDQEEALLGNQSAFALPVKQSGFVQEKALLGNQSAFALPVKQSAFVRYADQEEEALLVKRGFGSKSGVVKSNIQSVNKRMIEFLRRNWSPMIESKDSNKERCYRHMINERLRREKQKQSYSGLRSLLPPGTKSDKNSIIQVAAKEVQELEKYKAELERRNREIEEILAAKEGGNPEGAKIRLRVANPSSGIDSMLEVFKCLKNMRTKTRVIQSMFSDQELSAVLEIESEIEAAEVEKAVQRTLFEVEMKLRTHFLI